MPAACAAATPVGASSKTRTFATFRSGSCNRMTERVLQSQSCGSESVYWIKHKLKDRYSDCLLKEQVQNCLPSRSKIENTTCVQPDGQISPNLEKLCCNFLLAFSYLRHFVNSIISNIDQHGRGPMETKLIKRTSK